MAITTKVLENWKEEKANLQKEITVLKKGMANFRAERKSEWRSFKSKFKEDMEQIEKSLKVMTTPYKK